MRVLLLYPKFPATYWSFKHALKFVGKKASFPPLGLLTVAAMLPREWSLTLVDLNVSRLSGKVLSEADLVMISAMAVQQQSAREVVRWCKRAGKTVVAGGPLFTCEPEMIPEIDHLVLGEAECTLAPFLRDFGAGRAGRIYRPEGGFPSLEATPVPRWDLIEMRHYASMCIQYSRGCPYDCEFCNVTALLGHRPRLKSVPQILAELDALGSQGWQGSIFFVDDNFIGNKRALKNDLLPALISWQKHNRGIPFFTEASINLADDEPLMTMMANAGFDTVFVGIETPAEESLAECNKTQNRNRSLIDCVKKMQRFGLQVQAGFIVGFDSDTPSIFQRQIDFIQQSGILMAMVGILQAPVGTRLYERMRLFGRLRGNMSGDNTDGATNIIPLMDLETLTKGYHRILAGIYQPRPYYQRVKTFLREYRRPVVVCRMDRARIFAFFRSLVYLGLVGRERWEYWGLLIWTLRHRAELLPTAVNLAIVGYHFRKVHGV